MNSIVFFFFHYNVLSLIEGGVEMKIEIENSIESKIDIEDHQLTFV